MNANRARISPASSGPSPAPSRAMVRRPSVKMAQLLATLRLPFALHPVAEHHKDRAPSGEGGESHFALPNAPARPVRVHASGTDAALAQMLSSLCIPHRPPRRLTVSAGQHVVHLTRVSSRHQAQSVRALFSAESLSRHPCLCALFILPSGELIYEHAAPAQRVPPALPAGHLLPAGPATLAAEYPKAAVHALQNTAGEPLVYVASVLDHLGHPGRLRPAMRNIPWDSLPSTERRLLSSQLVRKLAHLHADGFTAGDTHPDNLVRVRTRDGQIEPRLRSAGHAERMKPQGYGVSELIYLLSKLYLKGHLSAGDIHALLALYIREGGPAVEAQILRYLAVFQANKKKMAAHAHEKLPVRLALAFNLQYGAFH